MYTYTQCLFEADCMCQDLNFTLTVKNVQFMFFRKNRLFRTILIIGTVHPNPLLGTA